MYLAYNKNNTLNKVLFVILITFVLVLVSVSSCFASFSGVFYDDYFSHDILYYLPDFNEFGVDYNYYAIVRRQDAFNRYFFICSSSPFTVTIYENGMSFNSINSSDVYFSNYAFYLNEDTFEVDFTTWSFSDYFVASGFDSGLIRSPDLIVYSNFDILSSEGDLIFSPEDLTNKPFIKNSDTDLGLGKFDNLDIDMGELEKEDNIFLHVASVDRPIAEDSSIIYYKDEKVFALNQNSPYFVNDFNNSYEYYSVPKSSFGFSIANDKEYCFILSSSPSSISNLGEDDIYDKVLFKVSGMTEADETDAKLDEQTEAIKENTETNKGIWESIKEILSYINPFSENFFVYQLIDLLIEAIKSLFIPSDGFFSDYFTELREWFSDRLGFLFYPFDIVIQILEDILNIDFSEPVFTIPDIKAPFTDENLISATTYNLNSLLEDNTFSTIHNIYLIVVDAFIVFGLVNLFRRKYEEVTTK